MTLSEVNQILWELARDGSGHDPIIVAADPQVCLHLAEIPALAAIYPTHQIGGGEACCYLFVGPTQTLYRVGALAMGSQVRAAILR